MPSVDHPMVSTCEFVVADKEPGSKVVCRPYAAGDVKPDYVVDKNRGEWVYFREMEKIVGSSKSVIFNLFPGNQYKVSIYGPDGTFRGDREFLMPDHFLEFGDNGFTD